MQFFATKKNIHKKHNKRAEMKDKIFKRKT